LLSGPRWCENDCGELYKDSKKQGAGERITFAGVTNLEEAQQTVLQINKTLNQKVCKKCPAGSVILQKPVKEILDNYSDNLETLHGQSSEMMRIIRFLSENHLLDGMTKRNPNHLSTRYDGRRRRRRHETRTKLDLFPEKTLFYRWTVTHGPCHAM
jgi:hypothetical protein